MRNDDIPALSEVIGINARRIRGTVTTDVVATAARAAGLKWGTGRISELEQGKVNPTLPTLLGLCIALSSATGRPVALTDLVRADGPVRINDALVMPGEVLAGALRGEPADQTPPAWEAVESLVMDMAIRQAGGETEQRWAQALGITGRRLMELSYEMWGRSFIAERDARAGDGANQQKRGRVARELKAEMRKRLDRGDDR